jgi:hypothetical protein
MSERPTAEWDALLSRQRRASAAVLHAEAEHGLGSPELLQAAADYMEKSLDLIRSAAPSYALKTFPRTKE